MTSQPYQFNITLNLAAPFLSHKAGAQQFGYDMSMLRDANNHPVFPGSLIRGNLLHTLKYFQKQLDQNTPEYKQLKTLIAYFGEPSASRNAHETTLTSYSLSLRKRVGERGLTTHAISTTLPNNQTAAESSNKPIRAALNFSYYWTLSEELLKQLSTEQQPRYRIGIDEMTGTTVKGNVQIIEALFASGRDNIAFSGNITAQLSATEAEIFNRWLNKALKHLTAIGALKGTGFGRIKTAQSTCLPITANPANIQLNDTNRIGVCLKLDRPFCIARPHGQNSNRFISEDFIPGNAIIGAMAQQYPDLTQGQDWFNKIRISHAFATSRDKPQRPAALPLSLAFYGEQLIDLAMSPNPEKIVLITKDGTTSAPAFQPDWKDSDFAQAKTLCQQLPTSHERHLIVRTAIDEASNQAKDEALFSLECIEPKQDVWCTDINLSALSAAEKHSAITTFKQIMAYRLRGIGKTKATAELIICKQAFNRDTGIKPIAPDNSYIITLQTQARLFAAPNSIKATGDQEALERLYADYWHHVSGNTLSLSYYFAQQTRVGGHFYWAYYRKMARPYQPEWLTQPGSVFVLKAAKPEYVDDINALLTEWQLNGLPQAGDRKKDNWQTNPYIRENGFGEIRVNDAIHLDFAASKAEGQWL